jgi:cytoskeletal protein CcmA (bactofilin family)
MKEQRRDLKIYGKGSAAGGTFDHVHIFGKGDISGNVACSELLIKGYATVDGNLQSQSMVIEGRGETTGNVSGGKLSIKGQMKIGGSLSIKEAEIKGETLIQSSMNTDTVRLHGRLNVKEDCTSELFYAEGGFRIGGLLNAGDIKINIYGPCRAQEIGGERITVVRTRASRLGNLLQHIFCSLDLDNKLETESIEGDEIRLEYVIAKVVRGKNVTIGPGCEIGLVEYRNKFVQTKDAHVKESNKI